MPSMGDTARPRKLVEEARLRVLDIFAGAGGLSTGLAKTGGFRTVEAVEWDRAAAATFAQNHREARVRAESIQTWLARDDAPEVDLIVGGPPCQGFSLLGKQDTHDERNSLWYEYAKTIVRVRPRWFLVENVPAFLNSRELAQFKLETDRGGMLADYTFDSRVLNAADYGAHQARKRAVLIGHHRDLDPPDWPEAEFVGRHRSVAQAFRGIPEEWTSVELPDRTVVFDSIELPGVFRTSELHLGRHYAPISLQRISQIPPGGNRTNIPDDLLPPCWRSHTSGSSDVMGRLHRRKPAVTIRTEFFKPEKGRYLHPTANRAITHLEAAVLQGFPRSYRWVGNKVDIARQIGNAVPIQLGAALGTTLMGAAGLVTDGGETVEASADGPVDFPALA